MEDGAPGTIHFLNSEQQNQQEQVSQACSYILTASENDSDQADVVGGVGEAEEKGTMEVELVGEEEGGVKQVASVLSAFATSPTLSGSSGMVVATVRSAAGSDSKSSDNSFTLDTLVTYRRPLGILQIRNNQSRSIKMRSIFLFHLQHHPTAQPRSPDALAAILLTVAVISRRILVEVASNTTGWIRNSQYTICNGKERISRKRDTLGFHKKKLVHSCLKSADVLVAC